MTAWILFIALLIIVVVYMFYPTKKCTPIKPIELNKIKAYKRTHKHKK